jgi:phenylacetate-CoA ligase
MEAMSEFADFIVENNLKVFSPKYIVSTIGPLEENVRKKISQAFSCSVFDQYGSREMGFIAAEFPENEGKLSFPWFNYVENTNGLVKNVIVTNLVNFSMPLIRYDIGDAAIVNNGNIKRLCGRTLGFFYKKDGSLIHTHFLVQTLFFVEWIKRFQIIQPNFRSIEIKVEKKENVLISPRGQREILQKVKKLIGDEVECKIKFVKRIHPQKNGKYAYTICKIPKENLKKLREQK